MVSPAWELSQPGLVFFGRRTCKPNSVVCGHSSRRRVAADTHQRPTRRFRQLLEAPQRRRPVVGDPARAALLHRADAERRLALSRRFPPYLVLLRVGFTLPRPLQDGRCALTAPFHPYPGGSGRPGEPEGPFRKPSSREARGVAEAVYFLWHWPSMGFEAHVPDVIRHTALRSSDFPPPETRFPKLPAATARSSCQSLVYRESGFTNCGKGPRNSLPRTF